MIAVPLFVYSAPYRPYVLIMLFTYWPDVTVNRWLHAI